MTWTTGTQADSLGWYDYAPSVLGFKGSEESTKPIFPMWDEVGTERT